MKTIDVEITGTTPILMNSPKAMLKKEKIRKTTKEYDREAEAEKVAYRNDDGVLFVPSTAVKTALIQAGAYKKAGRYALKPILASGIRIPEQELTLNTNKYEIHLTTVVIQRARVPKARPMIKNWKLNFQINYNENLISEPDIIKTCLEEAGERIGILDWRPQKTGEFGCFEVTKWKVNA